MINVSVIIPYFQRTPGILRRALESVLTQRLVAGIIVKVIVVDDGSPVSAQSEVEGIRVPSPFRLAIIIQDNGGVARARNTGLQQVDDTARYIAYLDSDDTWHDGHLQQGIDALEAGSDFYFCDQSREGHHSSYLASCSTMQNLEIKHRNPDNVNMLFWLTSEEATTAILRDFVSQASTTIHRRSIAPDLLFNVAQKYAGEDVIYFLELAAKAVRVCFSSKVMVDCGEGVNMYFKNLDWNGEGHLRRLVDCIRCYITIQQTMRLSDANFTWNRSHIVRLRRNFAFHAVRRFVKARGEWPEEVHLLAKDDKRFKWWFPTYAVQTVIGKAFGMYHPQ
jgi:succinoglycan biosynthesis protein ExoW